MKRRPLILTSVALAGVLLIGVAALFVWRRYREPPPIAVPLAADFRLGYNLDYPGDWTNLPPFIDNFKNARGFTGSCGEGDAGCEATAHLDLDAAGWVRSLRYRDEPSRAYVRVEAIVNTSKERHDAGERFAVTWEGSGTLELFGAEEAARDPARRRIEFAMPAGTLVLRLLATDPEGTGDYVRNIRVFRVAHEPALRAGQIFDPVMLAYLAPFRSLRFMDWMLSNASGRCSQGTGEADGCYAASDESCPGSSPCVMPGKWSERPTPDQAMWLSSAQFLDNARPERGPKVGGYPIEVMIDLANAAKAAPHFNVPADSDDEYVLQLARLIEARLAPELPVSVEYSNEVWNWGFPQAQYARVRGAALWPGDGTAWLQYMAARTNHMCKLFHQVFPREEGRLRCLISPQTGWREMAEVVLDCPAWVELHPEEKSCTEHVDAINVAGYFSGCLQAHPDLIRGWITELGLEAALARAFEQLEHGGAIEACEAEALDHAIDSYGYFMQLAARRGLGLEVYEGGTHFEYSGERDGEPDEVQRFLVRMTRDPRMYDLYTRNYRGFREAGGSTFNVWGWVAKEDAWANSDSAVDLRHPKYRAIADFSRAISGAR